MSIVVGAPRQGHRLSSVVTVSEVEVRATARDESSSVARKILGAYLYKDLSEAVIVSDYRVLTHREITACLESANQRLSNYQDSPIKELSSLAKAASRLGESVLGQIQQGRELSAIESIDKVVSEARRVVQDSAAKSDSAAFPAAMLTQSVEDLLRARSSLGILKCISDTPLLMADGLSRSSIFYRSPEVLKGMRKAQGFDPGECELIIIGGGPAGVAATYNAGRHGIDTVLFEAGYLMQAFSDARALSVHVMRTSGQGSSLFSSMLVPEAVREKAHLPALMERTGLREAAYAARSELSNITGIEFPRWLPPVNSAPDSSTPASRGEVFAGPLEIANLAAEFANVAISEQSPVTEIEWLADEKRFKVTTARGHEIKARYLVMAAGFVGSDAEFSAQVPLISIHAQKNPHHYFQIDNAHDFAKHAEDLALISKLPSKVGPEANQGKQLIIPDSLLGHAEARQVIQALPVGTKVAMIGSGEAASKSALTLLRLNPGIKVELFVKSKLEPAQSSIPHFKMEKNASLAALMDSEMGAATLSITKKHFGTPITPETLVDMLEQVNAGRLKIHELGAYFDEGTISLRSFTGPLGRATEIRLHGDRTDVSDNLEAQAKEWKALGLVGDDYTPYEDESSRLLATFSGPIITGVGYNRSELRHNNPLFQQLEDQGLVTLGELEHRNEIQLDPSNNLFSLRNSQLGFAGAHNMATAFDGGFGGAGLRSFLLTQRMARELGKLPHEEPSPDPSGSSKPLPEDRSEAAIELVPNSTLPPRLRFLGTPFLTEIATREHRGEALSPIEKLLLKRGDQLQDRIASALQSSGFVVPHRGKSKNPAQT